MCCRKSFILLFIYLNCKWVFTRWQWYYNKKQHTNNTKYTTLKQKTAHKTTQAKKDTLDKMNTMQIWFLLQQKQLRLQWKTITTTVSNIKTSMTDKERIHKDNNTRQSTYNKQSIHSAFQTYKVTLLCSFQWRSKTFVLYNWDLMKSQAKKSNGVKSGERGAQCFGAALPIHVFRKVLLR
jgi:hypothetical protein